MSKVTDESTNMYGITRIDNEKYRTHAWRVSLSRHKKMHVKNFSDKKCGDSDAALQQAIQHRDMLVKKYPPISRKEICKVKRSNNKTGITGVYKYAKPYTLSDGEIRENWYWEANWPDTEGESVCKSFSIKKYGDEIAKQKAIRARNKGVKNIEGVFWASKRGELELYSLSQLFASIKMAVRQVA
jgi:hypothetical protein